MNKLHEQNMGTLIVCVMHIYTWGSGCRDFNSPLTLSPLSSLLIHVCVGENLFVY